MKCTYFPKLGMPVLEPSSHRPSLMALLLADEDSHPQIKKEGRGGQGRQNEFSGDESLAMKLNSKAKSKNTGAITCKDSFLTEKGLREKLP